MTGSTLLLSPLRLGCALIFYGALQVRSAAEEYHAEFAAKEATIASLTAEAEAARSHMQAEIDKLRSEMEVGARSCHMLLAITLHFPQLFPA